MNIECCYNYIFQKSTVKRINHNTYCSSVAYPTEAFTRNLLTDSLSELSISKFIYTLEKKAGDNFDKTKKIREKTCIFSKCNFLLLERSHFDNINSHFEKKTSFDSKVFP